MSKIVRIVVVGVFTALAGIAFAMPASADVSIRAGKSADLYVRSATPSAGQLERQYAGFWNPNVPMNPKLEVSYRGDTAQVRKELGKVMATSRTMDFFSIKGRAVGTPAITGNRMTITAQGVMAGYPAQTFRYHYIRDAGLWKFDWKATCASIKCSGNPQWGY